MIERVFTHSAGIQSLCSTPHGLWIAHQGGLTWLDAATGRCSKWTTHDGIPALPVLHVEQFGERVALATPNGIAWTDDIGPHLLAMPAGRERPQWRRALAHPRGTGAYLNGVGFVAGRMVAATGGGRLYREGSRGFELIELPVKQARLQRFLDLDSTSHRLRLLMISNNNGVLLLATGAGEEPSLYQWSEQEGLTSRYVTAVACTENHVLVGVHGMVHVALRRDLVDHPETLHSWGRITLGDLPGPEQGRVYCLCVHGDELFIGAAAGVYRAPLAALASAAHGEVEAEFLDETPVRHLASLRGELWCVLHGGLGKFVAGAIATSPQPVLPPPTAGWRASVSRWRRRADVDVAAPRLVTFTQPWRCVPEPRWRSLDMEPDSQRITCLVSTPRGIACGGDSGRILFYDGTRWESTAVVRQRRTPEVHALAHDPEDGRLWCATRHGLFASDARGLWSREVAFPGRTVHHLTTWQGMLVALGSAGLHVHVRGAWNTVAVPPETQAFVVGAASDAGLALFARPGASYCLWRSPDMVPERLPLPVGRANCMAWDGPERLWIGTDHGLVCWREGKLDTYHWTAEAEDHVTALLIHAGRVHVGSQAGIWTASRADLEADSDLTLELRGRRLGPMDGLPHAHVTSLLSHADRVWVGTNGGLVSLL